MLSWKMLRCIQLMTISWLVGNVLPASFHGSDPRALESDAGIRSHWMSDGNNQSFVVVGKGRYRVRRMLLNQMDKDVVVELHNNLRREEGSSDMERLKWDDYLATLGEGWAQVCKWEHGQPEIEEAKLPVPEGKVGQNLYLSSRMGSIDYNDAIKVGWHNSEKVGYDYDTMQCSIEMCGHYTAVVWSTSRYVGCAWTDCDPMQGVDIAKGAYFVCNYSPAGNYRGKKPFKKGNACTQCETGAGWCDNGLCNRDCTSAGPGCECKAECHCGTLDSATCRCSCKPGWMGPDCSEKCENKHTNCGANPGWPKQWCLDDYKDAARIRESCPLMCGLCEAGNTSEEECRPPTLAPSMQPHPKPQPHPSSGNSLVYIGLSFDPITVPFLLTLTLIIIPPDL